VTLVGGQHYLLVKGPLSFIERVLYQWKEGTMNGTKAKLCKNFNAAVWKIIFLCFLKTFK